MDVMITMVLGIAVVALAVLLLRRVNGRQAVRVADFRPGRNLSRSRTPKGQPTRQSGPRIARTASTPEADARPRQTDGGASDGRDVRPPRGEGRGRR